MSTSSFKRSRFIGRESEIERLIAVWNQLRDGSGPKVVTLVADSGYGKTRIVDEFYSGISRGQHYWPEHLQATLDSIDINPRFDKFEPKGEIPWLWWGMRWSNPGGRNYAQDGGCAFTQVASVLSQHHEANLSRINRIWRDLGQSATGVAKGIAGMTPIGNILAGVELTKDICTAFKKAIGILKDQCEPISKLKVSREPYESSICEQCVDLLSSFLNPADKKVPTIPVLVVLDDAHWADSASLYFLYRLLEHASQKKWPLMVLTTHWETEWKNFDGKLPEDPSKIDSWMSYRQIEKLFEVNNQDEGFCSFETIEIGRMNCEPILKLAFPNIGQEATEHIIRVSDGNPWICFQFVSLLADAAQTRSFWFEEEDPDRRLTDDGLKKFQQKTLTTDLLLKTRVEKLRDHKPIEAVLQIGAIQGNRFLRQITLDIARKLSVCDTDLQTLLTTAESPLNLISLNEATLSMAEFKHRLLQLEIAESVGGPLKSEIEKQLRAAFDSAIKDDREPKTMENEEFFLFAREWLCRPGEQVLEEFGRSGLNVLAVLEEFERKRGNLVQVVQRIEERHNLLRSLGPSYCNEAFVCALQLAAALADVGRCAKAISFIEDLDAGANPRREIDKSKALFSVLRAEMRYKDFRQEYDLNLYFTRDQKGEHNERALGLSSRLLYDIEREFGSNSCERLEAALDWVECRLTFNNPDVLDCWGGRDTLILASLFFNAQGQGGCFDSAPEKHHSLYQRALSVLGEFFDSGMSMSAFQHIEEYLWTLTDSELEKEEMRFEMFTLILGDFPNSRTVYRKLWDVRVERYGEKDRRTLESYFKYIKSTPLEYIKSLEVDYFDVQLSELRKLRSLIGDGATNLDLALDVECKIWIVSITWFLPSESIFQDALRQLKQTLIRMENLYGTNSPRLTTILILLARAEEKVVKLLDCAEEQDRQKSKTGNWPAP